MARDRFSRTDIAVLIAVASSQLMGILDTTIVTTAIPVAAAELDLDAEGRQWIVTAYALAFGAVLLTGGRIVDYWGSKKTLILGVGLFVAASAWGGLAGTGVELLLARGLQGGSAALMAPAALAIVTIRFPGGRVRTIAFGLLGGIISSGAAIGLIAGGLLTEFAGWRWCLLVNVPVGLVAIILSARTLSEARKPERRPYDTVGAILVAVGMCATVYGVSRSSETVLRWDAAPIVLLGLAFLTAFVLHERRVRHPLLPLEIIVNRARGGALLVQICSGTVMAAVTLFVILHLQLVRGFSPLMSGLAMLPFAIGIAAAIPFFVRIAPRIGLKALLVLCPIVAAIGMALLCRIMDGGSYWSDVLPGILVTGIGMAGIFVSAQNVALLGVKARDSGAASAASQASNQVGGSLGLALLTNVFVLAGGESLGTDRAVAGFVTVFVVSSAIMLAASLVAWVLIPRASKSGELVAAATG